MDDTRELAPLEQPINTGPDIESLIPSVPIGDLTSNQTNRLQQFQTALIVLGQAASGALVCPGNQIGVSSENRCPYAAKCELLKAQKTPQGEICPIERELIISRFHGWCATINADPKTLREDQRAVVAELTWIDVQEQRCNSILSAGEAARLTQINVKDCNPETSEWISWERVIHSNAMLLESLHTRKRMIMREWMLTPLEKFKAARAMGKLGQQDDLSRRLSSRAEKLRNIDSQIIDAEYQELPNK
jgi:hypothetical protein